MSSVEQPVVADPSPVGALGIETVDVCGPADRVWTAPRWCRAATILLARGALVGLAVLLLCSVLPWFLGWQSTVVMTGSMNPTIDVGDIVVVRPIDASELQPGQVLLVDDPDTPGALRLHRLVERRGEDLVLRGDANEHDDGSPVSSRAVHGVGVIHVPAVGLPLVWASQHRWSPLMVMTIGVITLVGLALKPVADAGSSRVDCPPCSAGRRRGRALRRAALTGVTGLSVIATTLAGAEVVPAVGATFSAPTATTANVATSRYYTCAGGAAGLGATRYYPLQDTSSTTVVNLGSEGPAGDATLIGGTSPAQSGVNCSDGAGATTLDGTTQYVATPQTSLVDGVTVAGWFRLTRQQGGFLIGFGNAATGASTSLDRAIYVTSSGVVNFWSSTGSMLYTDSSDPQVFDLGWHFIAETYSSSGVSVMLDGWDYASFPGYGVPAGATGYWRMGYDNLAGVPNAPSTYYLPMQLAHVSIYNRVLTADELGALWASGV